MTKNQIVTSFACAAAALFIAGCDKNSDSETTKPDAAAQGDQATPDGEMGDDMAAGEEDGMAKVKCMGINECKGQGACDTATHDCAGKNECAGKGWIQVTRNECNEKGGTEV